MRVFGLAGWSGSGKTTLLTRLLPELIARGLTVSTVKHAHHEFDIDKPGKDSWNHRQAGATEVMVASANRWALMHEHRGNREPGLNALLKHMSPVDLVLVEGFKGEDIPKLEIYRAELGKPLLCREDKSIVALASDRKAVGVDLPQLQLDDIAGIAGFIMSHCGIETALHGAVKR
jgi:molybdopterin-guanine dinucleotide biosynthesis protein B